MPQPVDPMQPEPVSPGGSAARRAGIRRLGAAKIWALVVLGFAVLLLPAGVGGSLGFVGFVMVLVGVFAAIHGHAWWGWIATRRVGGLTVAAGFVLFIAGSSMLPTPPVQPVASTATASATSSAPPSPSTSSTVATTSPPSSPAATPTEDPDEATPATTASVPLGSIVVPASDPGSQCRTGNPLANVYHPYRLQVVSACSTVSGTVRTVRHEDDGDVHFDLALDPPYTGMLTPGNVTYQHGLLVVELIPADEAGCTVGQPPRPATGSYDFGTCTGDDLAAPSVGEHVWVTGPYVLDHIHNWAEIHPAWQISSRAPVGPKPTPAAAPAPAPAPPVVAPAPPPPAPATHAAPPPPSLTCSASVSNPSPSDYSTVDVLVHTAGGAQVQATANYKSTSTSHSATAGGDGTADVPFRISRAAPGYTVTVEVQVSTGSASAGCSTAFTPQ